MDELKDFLEECPLFLWAFLALLFWLSGMVCLCFCMQLVSGCCFFLFYLSGLGGILDAFYYKNEVAKWVIAKL